MEANGHAECLEGRPQRLVVGVVPGATVDQVRTEEDPTEAQLLDTALGLYDGVFNAGMIPNITENPRNRKHTKRGRKRFFNEEGGLGADGHAG